MKNNSIIFCSAITILLLFWACKKKENTPNNENPGAATAVINVTSLHESDTIPAGATVTIQGTITAPTEMHGYELILKNQSTNAEVLNYNQHDHETSYSFNKSWVNSVIDTTTMVLTIKAVKDHDGNIVTKTIQFVCLP